MDSTERFKQCLEVTLLHEGGFANHPKDPGGITNLGITKRVWEAWVGHPVTEDDMRVLMPIMVEPVYHDRYWMQARCDKLPKGIDLAVFDFAVNAGPSRAIKSLQMVVKTKPDGAFGPKTQKCVDDYIFLYGMVSLISEYTEVRMTFHKSLSNWSTFGRGWSKRIRAIHITSHSQAYEGSF